MAISLPKDANRITVIGATSSTDGVTVTTVYVDPVTHRLLVDNAGSSTIAIGDTVTSGTAGSVLYVGTGPVLAQDNANFFWDATNHRLGIGTTSPAGLLDISKAISGTPSASVGRYLSISTSTFTDNVTAGSGTAAGMLFNSIAAPTLAATNSSVTTTSAINFYIAGAPVMGTNETFTSSTALYIDITNTGAATRSYGMQVNAQTGATSNYAAAFYGGNVGIGTSTPNQLLHVSKSQDTDTVIRVQNSSNTASARAGLLVVGDATSMQMYAYSTVGGNYATILSANNAEYRLWNQSNTAMTFYTNNAEAMRILASGYVGIGATNPQASLDIVSTTEQMRLEYDGSHYHTFTVDSSGNLNVSKTGGGNYKFDGVMALGGTAIDTNIVLTTSTNTNDPAAQTTGANFSRTLVLTATNSQQIRGGAFNVSTQANNFSQTGQLRGSLSTIQNSNTNTVSDTAGAENYVYNVGAGTITTARGTYSYVQNLNASGVITNAYGVYATIGFNNGTITNTYGVYVTGMVAATQTNTPYDFYAADTGAKNYFAGPTGMGTTSPTAVLHLKAGTASANTSPLKFTSGTLLSSPEAGAIEFLTDAFYGTVTTGPTRQQFVTDVNTVTLTNKRITLRIGTETSSATSTPTGDTVDQWNITALAAADAIAAPTGTPTDGQKLTIRIKDNGTARALTWNAIYRASSDLALPSTTVLSKTMYCGFIYNAADSKWDFVSFLNNI